MENNKILFKGEGSRLFGIFIVNVLLTIVTLGIYYPWARVAMLKFFYEETEFAGSRFTFHGQGKELLRGYLIALAIFGGIYGLAIGLMALQSTATTIIGTLVLYLGAFLLTPIVIHGSLRYRASRSSWRGIFFRYEGELKPFIKEFLLGSFFSLITLGIYWSWLENDLRRYAMDHLKFGNLRFKFLGEGGELLFIHFKGIFLTMFTFGIYFFWYRSELYNFYTRNIRIYQNGNIIKLRPTASGGDFFGLMLGNFLLTMFTFGLALPWATIRTTRFILENAIIDGQIDPDSIEQSVLDHTNATGDSMADIMDAGFFDLGVI